MNKPFNEALRAARRATGLSQQGMADRMLISKRNIEKWETGERVPPEYVQRFVLNELEGGAKNERGRSEWEFVKEPNTVDTLGRPVYHARCKKCGFVWTDLYAVKNYFKSCPHCGAEMKGVSEK